MGNYNDTMVKKSVTNVKKSLDVSKLINGELGLSEMSLGLLRDVATALQNSSYDEEAFGTKVTYENKELLTRKLNEEFNRRLGETASKMYDAIDKHINKEKWNGEQRCYLFVKGINKGYSEMEALKNTVWFMKVNESKVTPETAIVCRDIVSNGLYWDFNKKSKDASPCGTPEQIELFEKEQMEECKTQNNFINLVFGGQWEEAYKLIERQVNERMEILFPVAK